MNANRILLACAVIAAAPLAVAQSWEFGGGLGGSFFTTQSVTRATASADATIKSNVAGGVWLGNSIGRHWGGEVRIDYERGDLQLTSGPTSVQFPAEVYTLHYEVLYHFLPRTSKVRPFVGGGGGVRFYRGTGTESAVQPLNSFAFLTRTNELKPVAIMAAGVKWQINHSLQFRVEAHDYLTTVPAQIIAPNFGSQFKGWFNNIVPMAGLSYTWGE